MTTPMFTGIEESDLPAEPQPSVPSVPPPMFTDITPLDVVCARLAAGSYCEPGEPSRPFRGYRSMVEIG